MHIQRVRHTMTKAPVVRPSLAWLYHRGLKSSDIFVASYPRAGSTWLRFLLHELLTGESSNFNRVNASIPDIGHHNNAPQLVDNESRLVKTHEPYRKEYGRAVYLVRDVRDVAISEYYFQQLWKLYDGSFQNFLDDFLAGKVNRYGSWDKHTNSWLNATESTPDQILVVRFDELRQDTVTTMANILAFIGTPTSESEIEQAIVNNTTTKMRAKERDVNFAAADQNFVRKGTVGGWQESLTGDQIRQIEECTGNTLRRLDYLVGPVEK